MVMVGMSRLWCIFHEFGDSQFCNLWWYLFISYALYPGYYSMSALIYLECTRPALVDGT